MRDIFLLDIDDTLLDFCKAEREQLLAVLRGKDERADGEIAAYFHAVNERLWQALERGETTRARLVTERFGILKEKYALRTPAAELSSCFLEAMRTHACLFEGAENFLRALSRRGKIYAVTNGAGEVQRRHLKDTGIAGYFAGLFISEEAGSQKPSAEYAAYVAAHIPAFDPARAVYVGDSLTSDMVCADRLGVPFILFRPAGTPEGYTGLCAQSYREALRLIDDLSGAL